MERRRSRLKSSSVSLRSLQPLVEFLLRVRRLDLRQLAVHFLVGRQQAQLFRALHQDFVVDELAQNAQPQTVGLLRAGLLRGLGSLVVEVLLHFGAGDLVAIHAAPSRRRRPAFRNSQRPTAAQPGPSTERRSSRDQPHSCVSVSNSAPCENGIIERRHRRRTTRCPCRLAPYLLVAAAGRLLVPGAGPEPAPVAALRQPATAGSRLPSPGRHPSRLPAVLR